MATKCFGIILKPIRANNFRLGQVQEHFHTCPALFTVQSAKPKSSIKGSKPISYEDAFSPPHIAHRKSWNSWNTSTIEGGHRPAETTIDDLFIRKFMEGTFPGYLLSKVIIKRQYNIIRIAAVINSIASERRLCFLIGYSETLLSYWFHCNVKIEFQVLNDPRKFIFKYI